MGLFKFLDKKYSNGYRPRELGLDVVVEKCEMIFLDDCISVLEGDKLHSDNPMPKYLSKYYIGAIAHAHLCPFEKHLNAICIPSKVLKDKHGKTSDVLLHEYGHVLTEFPKNALIKHEGTLHRLTLPDKEITSPAEYNVWAHGDMFKDAMTSLGRPDLSVPYINTKYWEDAFEWNKP